MRDDFLMTGDLLFLGSNGKVARLLRSHARGEPLDGLRPIWHARGETSPGAQPPARAIVALWGVTSGSDTLLRQNTDLALAALALARQTGAARVLHMSSAAIYGAPSGPVCEDTEPDPRTPYARAKLAMEQAIAQWHADTPSRLQSVILRLGNVAGADRLFASLATGAPVLLDRFADGTGPSRSYVAPRDLLHILTALARADDLPGVLNIAGPAPVAMADIVRAAGAELLWRDAPADALPCLTLDTGRLKRLVGPLPDSASPTPLVAQWRECQ